MRTKHGHGVAAFVGKRVVIVGAGFAGLFAAPEYGGSGGEVGNALIGFEDRHVWQPPYGYYDADYAEKGE